MQVQWITVFDSVSRLVLLIFLVSWMFNEAPQKVQSENVSLFKLEVLWACCYSSITCTLSIFCWDCLESLIEISANPIYPSARRHPFIFGLSALTSAAAHCLQQHSQTPAALFYTSSTWNKFKENSSALLTSRLGFLDPRIWMGIIRKTGAPESLKCHK